MLKDVKIWFGDPHKAQVVMDYLVAMGYDPDMNGIGRQLQEGRTPMYALFGDTKGYITYLSKEGRNFYDNHHAEEILWEKPTPSALPPIGLRPKAIVDALRIKEILEAMVRYSDDGKQIPQEWVDELSIVNSEKA